MVVSSPGAGPNTTGAAATPGMKSSCDPVTPTRAFAYSASGEAALIAACRSSAMAASEVAFGTSTTTGGWTPTRTVNRGAGADSGGGESRAPDTAAEPVP